MTYFPVTGIKASDSPSIDAFDRLRVSNPSTLFDSKQIHSNLNSLFWSVAELSGSGTSSSYSQDRASTTLTVSNTTAGSIARQTKQFFNYQPGKSHLVLTTFVFGDAATGITRRAGYFNENNGIFLEQTSGGMSIVKRSHTTGSPVDDSIPQASWNIDTFDGSGPSGITIDLDKANIFIIDLEWLGVGRVRTGFVVDGIIYYAHAFNNANNLDVVYMSTPNLPVRYELTNDGTGPESNLEAICATVMSEGGQEDIGATFSVNNGATHVDATATGTRYALIGVRLKSTHLDATVKTISGTVLSTTNDYAYWELVHNPTVAGTFTYASVSDNSSCEYATGATANTVTGGIVLASGYTLSNRQTTVDFENSIPLGSQIDGTRDTLVLCATPISAGLDAFGVLTWRELL